MVNSVEVVERRKVFGEALARMLEDKGMTRAALGAEVSRRVGLASPITQPAVTEWVNGTAAPAPDRVFAVEAALGCPPGSLSRVLGYLPVDAQPSASVTEAIDADPALTRQARRMLRAAYHSAVSG